MPALDTSPEAHAVQLARLRRMTPTERLELGIQLSDDMRSVTRAGIAARHPDYSSSDVAFALYRLLLGDDLFRRAWPRAPVLAP